MMNLNGELSKSLVASTRAELAYMITKMAAVDIVVLWFILGKYTLLAAIFSYHTSFWHP